MRSGAARCAVGLSRCVRGDAVVPDSMGSPSSAADCGAVSAHDRRGSPAISRWRSSIARGCRTSGRIAVRAVPSGSTENIEGSETINSPCGRRRVFVAFYLTGVVAATIPDVPLYWSRIDNPSLISRVWLKIYGSFSGKMIAEAKQQKHSQNSGLPGMTREASHVE
jgi:hypothetical protein